MFLCTSLREKLIQVLNSLEKLQQETYILNMFMAII